MKVYNVTGTQHQRTQTPKVDPWKEFTSDPDPQPAVESYETIERRLLNDLKIWKVIRMRAVRSSGGSAMKVEKEYAERVKHVKEQVEDELARQVLEAL